MKANNFQEYLDEFKKKAKEFHLFTAWEIPTTNYKELLDILLFYTTIIQGHHGDHLQKREEDDKTNFINWNAFDKMSLWKPGQVTEIRGRNGTGKTNFAIGMTEDATRRESPQRTPIVVLSNIGFYEHVYQPKEKGGWGVKQVHNFNQVLAIIAEYFIGGIQAWFILLIDEWDNTVNAGTAIKGTTRIFIKLYFQIRKLKLALITILHYEADSNIRVRGGDKHASNAYSVINKGYYYQGKDDALDMGIKQEIEDSLTIAPVWKEGGTTNLQYIPNFEDDFNTDDNTAFEIDPRNDYGELFLRLAKLPPIPNTPAAKKGQLMRKGKIIKDWLEECKKQIELENAGQKNPEEKHREEMDDLENRYKNKLSNMEREKLRNEMFDIKKWKEENNWDNVFILHKEKYNRGITINGLKQRFQRGKELLQ